MLTAAERRRGVRELYRARGGSGDPRELAFTVYAAVLVAIVAVFPVARAAVLVLMEGPFRSTIDGAAGGTIFAMLLCGVLSLFILLGAMRGPAIDSPVATWTLVASDVPRRAALRSQLIQNTALVAALTGAVALLPGLALVALGSTSPLDLVQLVASALVFGVLATFGWLVGQVRGSSSAWLVATGVFALGLLTVAVPELLPVTPWGWVGHVFTPGQESWPLLALTGLALAAISIAPLLVDRLRGPALLNQALRWENARVATITGDVALTLALFRPLPTLGRRWRAVKPGLGAAGTYWWRGLVGSARTPVRMLGALVLLAVGNVALAAALGATPNAGALAGAAAGLLIFIALGPLSDGLRHASEAAAAPALYGFSRGTLVALLALFPASLGLAGAVAAGLSVSAAEPLGLLSAVLVGGVALLCRVLQSAKGPLPPALLTPVPTPFGDASSLVVLGWQLDALLICAVSGAVSGFAISDGNIAIVVGAPVVAGGFVFWLAGRRYRRR